MTRSSMVVSRDWQEISVLECILGGLHIGVDVEAHPDRARAKLSRSKVDAMIVDCDVSSVRVELRRFYDADHAPIRPRLRSHIVPVLATVGTNVNEAIVTACPDQVFLRGALDYREDRVVDLDPGIVLCDRAARGLRWRRGR